MTNKVWMVGMMLIAFVIGMLFSQNTSAQQGEIGRYQMAAYVFTRGGVSFRLNTATGEAIFCTHTQSTEDGRIDFTDTRGCGAD